MISLYGTTKSEKCRVTAVLSCIATGSMLSAMIYLKEQQVEDPYIICDPL